MGCRLWSGASLGGGLTSVRTSDTVVADMYEAGRVKSHVLDGLERALLGLKDVNEVR